MSTWACEWASKCKRVILPLSYFWHGCVVSQAAAQLVNINAVWRSDGDWSWHVVTLWWKALWNDVAGVFLLSAERWQAGCGICVFVCASMTVWECVCVWVFFGFSLGAFVIVRSYCLLLKPISLHTQSGWLCFFCVFVVAVAKVHVSIRKPTPVLQLR